MSGIELIVRPYVSGDTSPTVVVHAPTPNARPANIRLRVGRNGSPKTFSGNYSISTTVYVKKSPLETLKTT